MDQHAWKGRNDWQRDYLRNAMAFVSLLISHAMEDVEITYVRKVSTENVLILNLIGQERN